MEDGVEASSLVRAEQELLVEHEDNGHIHRRIVKFQSTNIASLKGEIFKVYKDVILSKIARAAGTSEQEVPKSTNLHQFICLSTYNRKYQQNIDMLNIKDIENNKVSMEIKPFHVIDKKTSKGNGGKSDDDAYDIALQIKDMKIHIHVSEKGEHKFVPFWCDYDKMVQAKGPLPAGLYKMWCPVYSQGQGYVSVGTKMENSVEMYNVSITGLTDITPPNQVNATDVRMIQSPVSDLCTRIKFESVGAILCYRHSDGAVFAVSDPEKAGKDYQYDFWLVRMGSPFDMYYQIFNQYGPAGNNGPPHYLSATNENTLIRIKHNIDSLYKNPSTMFAFYRQTTDDDSKCF